MVKNVIFDRSICVNGIDIDNSGICKYYNKLALVDMAERKLKIPSCFKKEYKCYDNREDPVYKNYLNKH